MRKTQLFLIVSVVLALIMTGCGGGLSEGTGTTEEPTGSAQDTSVDENAEIEYPELVLKLSTPSADDTAKSYDCRLFIDLVTERSGGKITFDEYFNATLSTGQANLEAVSTGIADVGTVVTLYTPSNLPLAQISYPIPLGPTDPKMIRDIMTSISEKHPEFYEEYENNNVHVLAYKGSEPFKVYSVDQITTLSDFSGKKLGMAGIYYTPWFESQGVAPVGQTIADAYQNAKSGVNSGLFTYDSIIYDYKLYEVVGYIFNVGMGARNTDTLAINLDVWNSLDANTQALLQECATDAYDEFHAWSEEKIVEWNQRLLDNGMVETVISDEDKEQWATEALEYEDTIQTWIDEVTALGYDGAGFMRSYLEIAEELGYEWSFDTSKY